MEKELEFIEVNVNSKGMSIGRYGIFIYKKGRTDSTLRKILMKKIKANFVLPAIQNVIKKNKEETGKDDDSYGLKFYGIKYV